MISESVSVILQPYHNTAMFNSSSKYYDYIYHWKDYRSESNRVFQVIKDRLPNASELLNVACGTGEHDRFLKEFFQITGVDLNSDFIDQAKKKNENCAYHVGDMFNLNLEKEFDVVACLFSSIGYADTKEKLNNSIAGMAKHLKPGGVLLIEPWILPEAFEEGRMGMQTYEGDELLICRVYRSSLKNKKSILSFHHLISEKGQEVKTFMEEHSLGLYTRDELKLSFEAAGLSFDFMESGLTDRGLCIGIKPDLSS